MRRISIVGPSGAGKSTLAAELETRLGLPHVELDAVYHQAGWLPLETQAFREVVRAAVLRDTWIVDGNYSKVRDLILARADTVIWLRYGRWLSTRRLLLRSIGRVVTRAELWNGNTERARDFLDLGDPENLLRWSWASHEKHRRRYGRELVDPTNHHITYVLLEDQRQTDEFVGGLGSGATS